MISDVSPPRECFVWMDIVRARFTAPRETLRELFGRMTFNVLVGNTDDHARNHAAFWDGGDLALTPAYDICPQPRIGREASQAMLIHGVERRSRLSSCLAAAKAFLLPDERVMEIVKRQIAVIGRGWNAVCGAARLTRISHMVEDRGSRGVAGPRRSLGCHSRASGNLFQFQWSLDSRLRGNDDPKGSRERRASFPPRRRGNATQAVAGMRNAG